MASVTSYDDRIRILMIELLRKVSWFNILNIISQKLFLLAAILNSTPWQKNARTFGRDLGADFSINDPKK